MAWGSNWPEGSFQQSTLAAARHVLPSIATIVHRQEIHGRVNITMEKSSIFVRQCLVRMT